MAVCQNLVPLVNIKIAGKWMFIPLNMVLIGIDPYPYMGVTFYHYGDKSVELNLSKSKALVMQKIAKTLSSDFRFPVYVGFSHPCC